MPVLAAIQGGCIGGGVDMISACDVRYATEDAFFCIQEINLGLTADVGTLQRLPKLMPTGVVRELAYTGRRMPAARAKEVGLVNEIYPTHDALLAGVLATAAEIAEKSPLAIWGSKQMLNYARDHSVEDGLELHRDLAGRHVLRRRHGGGISGARAETQAGVPEQSGHAARSVMVGRAGRGST